MKKQLRSITTNLKNIPGWKTSRKLIVFESDDWGGERMPSVEALNYLESNNFLKPGNYDRNDSLEQWQDLEMFYDVLRGVKDKNGNACVFSPFVNTANPDYDKIAANGYSEYYCEPFNMSLRRKGVEKETMDAWGQGIAEGIFMPQFHGREHLNVHAWMHYLKHGNAVVREAFGQGFYAAKLKELKPFLQAFRPTYYFDSVQEISGLNASGKDGLRQFEELFGYRATVFVPANGIYSNLCDEALAAEGIKAIGTSYVRDVPNGKGGLGRKFFFSGKTNSHGQVYYIRNAQFEPALGKGINQCIASVEAAFRWGKPAVISSHRINYIGSLNPSNRDDGLEQLKKLLAQLLKRWPDAEFTSSAELIKIMTK